MKLQSLNSGYFKLDGGAMFGVVPKSLWNKLNPADDNNLCTWAMRCLLVETDTRKIIVDTGLGSKQDEKFRSHFEPHGDDSIKSNLTAAGLKPEDITDVFLTHLHFDHVGGAVVKSDNGELLPAFPNARYWTNKIHWEWALNPNDREKASFLKENILPLQEHGALEWLSTSKELQWHTWIEGIDYLCVYGHTEAMMILRIYTGKHWIYYPTDLIPSSHHVAMPYIMSYDLRPLETLKEKSFVLKDVIDHEGFLFFEHDPKVACAKLQVLPNGRIACDTAVHFEDIDW
jgi:glyoxylase-like metal-dependent hydrolase (beta-lactamase superfamily II)